MATKLGVAPNYFTDFDGGQGAGASNYFNYAPDLDTNFVAIKASLNAVIDEVQAVGGTAAVIAFDIVQWNDPLGPEGTELQGIIGSHSYKLSFPVSTTIQVERGQAVLNGTRGNSASVVSFTGITGDGDKFVALDAAGVPFLETTAGQRTLDVAKVTMTGGALVASTLEQLAFIFQDGDDAKLARDRPRDGTVWSAGLTPTTGVPRAGFKIFRNVANRIEALERLISGRNTDVEGDALPAAGIPGGSASTPGLVLTDGAGTRDVGSGLYRIAANVLGIAISTVAKVRIDSTGVKLINGSEANPSLAATGDTDTGLRWGTTFLAAVVSAADVVQFVAGQALAVVGVVANPSWSFIGRTGVGWFSPGATRMAATTDGANVALEIDALGNVDLPRQTRGIARRAAAQNQASGTTLNSMSFDTQDEDIGGSFAPTSADVTIPTDGGGRYGVTYTATFDESTSSSPNLNDRGVGIEFNGVVLSPVSHGARVAGDTEVTTYAEAEIAAGQIIRGQFFQDSTGTMDVTGRITWRKLT